MKYKKEYDEKVKKLYDYDSLMFYGLFYHGFTNKGYKRYVNTKVNDENFVQYNIDKIIIQYWKTFYFKKYRQEFFNYFVEIREFYFKTNEKNIFKVMTKEQKQEYNRIKSICIEQEKDEIISNEIADFIENTLGDKYHAR